MFTFKIHKLIIRCKDENTEEDEEQGIHKRIEHLKDIRNNTEWLLFARQVGGGGHRGDVGDDGERPRQRRRGAEGPSGPGDWLGHAGLVFCDGNCVSIMIVLLLTLGCIIHEHIVKEVLLADHGTRI